VEQYVDDNYTHFNPMTKGFFCNTVLKTVKMRISARLWGKWPCSYYTASV